LAVIPQSVVIPSNTDQPTILEKMSQIEEMTANSRNSPEFPLTSHAVITSIPGISKWKGFRKLTLTVVE
jgi:hypothetical protein